MLALRARINDEVAFWRMVERLIKKAHFEGLWAEASDKEKKAFETHLERRSRIGVRGWIRLRTLASTSFENWPMTQLRPLGRDLGVFDYHILRKQELIDEIYQALDAEADRATGSGSEDASALERYGDGVGPCTDKKETTD